MVLSEKTETGEVIFTGKKKYKRVFLKHGVQWRRFKTNHQVTKEQQEILEEEYRISFPTTQPYLVPAGVKKLDVRNDSDRKILERGMVTASENGKLKLVGVKYIKRRTNMGLKDSKEYFEAFFIRRDAYNKLKGLRN